MWPTPGGQQRKGVSSTPSDLHLQKSSSLNLAFSRVAEVTWRRRVFCTLVPSSVLQPQRQKRTWALEKRQICHVAGWLTLAMLFKPEPIAVANATHVQGCCRFGVIHIKFPVQCLSHPRLYLNGNNCSGHALASPPVSPTSPLSVFCRLIFSCLPLKL